MWLYEIATGSLFSAAGSRLAIGYSGAPGAVNDPSKVSIPNIGPIPPGLWTIGEPYNDDLTGPYTLPLVPSNDTDTYGRTDFRIHGDSVVLAGLEKASKGCIILARFAREAIWSSGDRHLQVVAEST
jgi:Protein of unknown function (DUF2778)